MDRILTSSFNACADVDYRNPEGGTEVCIWLIDYENFTYDLRCEIPFHMSNVPIPHMK
jgi:hypothetical protein